MAPKSQIPRSRYGSPRNAAHHVFCESAKRNFGYSCKRATVHLTGLTDGGRKPEKSHSSGKPCGSFSFPNLEQTRPWRKSNADEIIQLFRRLWRAVRAARLGRGVSPISD